MSSMYLSAAKRWRPRTWDGSAAPRTGPWSWTKVALPHGQRRRRRRHPYRRVLVDNRLAAPAEAAISSIEVPSNPRSANSRLPMSSNCWRRSWPVIRFRLGFGDCSVTETSSRYAAALSVRVTVLTLRLVIAAEDCASRSPDAWPRAWPRPASGRRRPSRAARTTGSPGRTGRSGP